jgi:mRNA interferase RelE/StbE
LAWRIDYTATAINRLRKLDKPLAKRIVEYMDMQVAVLENPRSAGKALTGPMGGLWRYRVGDFRVICEIQDGVMRVLVIELGNRRDVYR